MNVNSLFVDFDDTMVESHKAIISLLNERYGVNKTEEDLIDWGYQSIAKTNSEEIRTLYESEDFWKSLRFKPGCYEALSRLAQNYLLCIVSKGTKKNLEKKEQWLKENLRCEWEFIGIENNVCKNDKALSKRNIDMHDCIQIDDVCGALDTNAQIKILYKDYHNYDWQQDYVNSNILVVDSWKEIEEIVNFFNIYDYKTLNKR